MEPGASAVAPACTCPRHALLTACLCQRWGLLPWSSQPQAEGMRGPVGQPSRLGAAPVAENGVLPAPLAARCRSELGEAPRSVCVLSVSRAVTTRGHRQGQTRSPGTHLPHVPTHPSYHCNSRGHRSASMRVTLVKKEQG